jgi:chitinase
MIQAYNNWYDGVQGGSLSFLQDVYYHWSNIKSPFCAGCNPIPNFTGVNGSKLVIGVLASPSAGGAAYFANNTIIKSFIDWSYNNSFAIAGMMMWDTHWDSLNGFNISNTVIQ